MGDPVLTAPGARRSTRRGDPGSRGEDVENAVRGILDVMKNYIGMGREGAAAGARVRRAAWFFGVALVFVVGFSYSLGAAPSLPVFGQAAGLLGLVFVVISLVLMLRSPALARFCGGLEAMYALHRGFGLAGYGFILLHPLLLASKGGWEVLTLAGKNLDFRSGWTAALVLMVILTCTFILKTRGYAIWRRIHLLSVVAFAFMAWHVWSYQTDWSPAGMLLLDLLILTGLVVPLLRYFLVDEGRLATPFVVEAVGHPASGVIDLLLAPLVRPLAITPGQFVFARFQSGPDYAGCGHFHPFTASAIEADGRLRLSIKSNGACTRLMQQLAPGTRARLQGPFGELFQNVRQDSQVWIAGGIGITPFLARARQLDPAHVPVRLFYFFDQAATAPFIDELQSLAERQPKLSFHPVATQGSAAPLPLIFDALLPPWDDKHYVLCGPEGFVETVEAYLARNGVRADAVSRERFEFR